MDVLRTCELVLVYCRLYFFQMYIPSCQNTSERLNKFDAIKTEQPILSTYSIWQMEKFLWKQSDKISKDSVTIHIIYWSQNSIEDLDIW